jgi:dUTP pyrophosphatase
MIHYFSKHGYELKKATDGASGYDLIASEARILHAREWALISTGIYLAMSLGIEAQVRSRSGMSVKFGVVVLNAPGTIDSDYRGEVKVCLINHSLDDYPIGAGDRIAQLVFAPVYPDCHYIIARDKSEFVPLKIEAIEQLESTQRGEGGFGSTGR